MAGFTDETDEARRVAGLYQDLRIIESELHRLEKTLKITKSNHNLTISP